MVRCCMVWHRDCTTNHFTQRENVTDDKKMAETESKHYDETETKLYVKVLPTQWPIVYGHEYNIGFLGLERLHPFDAGKWGKVYGFLKEAGMIRDDTTVRPVEATENDLLKVHTKGYINSLRLTSIVEGTVLKEWSMTVAGITEVPPVALLPNFIVQRKVLRPFRYQTGGTILAAKLAIDRGWGINIGGGFHHCSSEKGGGFCAYADITLAVRFLFSHNPQIKKAMIVDLDAHQGNGHERDFMNDESVYIMDVYNRGIYPHDGFAKRAIRKKVELTHGTADDEYLDQVEKNLDSALNEFKPDVIVYNAGTDILDGDPLGNLCITPQGIVDRDEIVFRKAHEKLIPIVMVTSGGYQRCTAQIIANSILNLRRKGLIKCEEAENCPTPASGCFVKSKC
ncbi:histone deacetylase 11-like isoform X2 [Mercenaria mercenaria]|uniref:histone deacetylase 11-like isoform X2 n=1 Tax=Mercenaria mercenaria TaxID=6596 RepID=UPI00234EAA91|nr:histone deacetylase 11-like isoform X2 [Mercenaria mercenaria]XP_045164225.2 histone deacetylase 11-like isoform X2 [Mercenaria mercenaria]